MWCQDNNLSLNITKTKEMIVDYRKRRTEHAPVMTLASLGIASPIPLSLSSTPRLL